MISTKVASCGTIATKQAPAQLLKGFVALSGNSTVGLRASYISVQQRAPADRRNFSTTPSRHIKEFFPKVETKDIRKTEAAWPHPGYSAEDMMTVQVGHRAPRNLSDRTALLATRILRWGLDTVSGYKHLPKDATEEQRRKYGMTEEKYMIRNIFLESVAGVPGMVAGMLRHLRSMRLMRRDNGWIESLLEESYNERMHLLTFLKMAEPGLLMRTAVLGAQGVWFNSLFVLYLFSPRTFHRFIGYLEEEAVKTYTAEIADIDAGKLPHWAKMDAPAIAIDYWKMPEGHRTMRDLLLYIRADEAKHREVNHTFGNLNQKEDPNPFVSEYKDLTKPHPGKGLTNLRTTGWEREEII